MGGVVKFDARDRALAIEAIMNRAATVAEVMEKVMKPDIHYGTIPGTNDKKVLLKAGAEKLSAVFRLTPQFTVHQTDYQNFHREYRVTCRLSDGTEGVGTCTTLEEKYRYRKSGRKCPKCGKEQIIEGKAEYGGGWLCWAKKGGCGTKFAIADPAIAQQNPGKVEHQNPADYWNTCLKMSKKRAHVDAIITATATSDLLTQDLEEVQEMADQASAAIDGEPKKTSEPKKTATPRTKKTEKTQEPDNATTGLPEKEAKRLFAWLDACKDAFVAKLEADEIMLPFAWAWCVQTGIILPNESLKSAQATKLFPTVNLNANVEANKPVVAEDFRKNIIAIETLGKAGQLDEVTMKSFFSVYDEPAPNTSEKPEKPIEVPRDRDVGWKLIPVPAWSKHSKVDGHKTFGDLPKAKLWWWVVKWAPTGYKDQPPKEEEIKLRKILDAVKEQYDFENNDSGSEPASRAAEPTTPPPVEDDVPF